jgi:predicted metal-dependent phosphoesterase TrpH
MIDLHTHTTESDGTLSPLDLLKAAQGAGIRLLAITDHDTFAGYDAAVAEAPRHGIALLCGIELSMKLDGHSAHLLGYFRDLTPLDPIREWLAELQRSRKARNRELTARLQALGIDITLEEAEKRSRGVTGRPMFAQLLLEKGHVATLQQAFDEYLAEGGRAYVERLEPSCAEAIAKIRDAGGIASLAHPVRLRVNLAEALPTLCRQGLNGIEVYHSDHSPEQIEQYLASATQYGLQPTGGSDFHGANKPGIELRTGRGGNLRIPESLADNFWPYTSSEFGAGDGNRTRDQQLGRTGIDCQ